MNGEQELKKAYESILNQHFEKAVEWFQKAIEQDPDNGEYHYKLSITYARSGKTEEALKHARKAFALTPGRAEFAIHLNTLEAKQLVRNARRLLERPGSDGQSLAAAYLREAIRLDPLEEEAYLLLADACARMNEYREAIATLYELLALDPGHEPARYMLERYKQTFSQYLEEKL